MPETIEKPLEERLQEALEKLSVLSDAAWDLLSAVEGANPEEIASAKRRLGLVFLDL